MRGRGRYLWAAILVLLALPQAALAAFAGSTVLVSRPTGIGAVPPAFDGDSQTPGSLSSDGRYAVFTTQADGLAPGENPLTQTNVLLRDTTAGTTTLVSRSDGVNGAGVNQNASAPAIAIAAAGVMPTAPTNQPHVLVVFMSSATNLVDHATHALVNPGGLTQEVWLRDVTAGTTTLVSRASGVGGAMANGQGVLEAPAIDVAPGGPVVAFQASSTNLGATPAGGIYLRTVNASATELISCENANCGGTPAAASGDDPAVRVVPGTVQVAFTTNDKTMTGDVAGHRQVVVALAAAPATKTDPTGPPSLFPVVSKLNLTTWGNNDSSRPSFNGDGRVVGFLSMATNLTADTVSGTSSEAFSHDFGTGNNTLLSRATGAGGAPSDHPIDNVALGGDETHVRAVFETGAGNLGANNDRFHAYVRDVNSNVTSVLDRPSGTGGNPSDQGADSPAISADGSSALFSSSSDDLGAGGGTGFARVYKRALPASDVTAGTLQLVSRPTGTAPFRSLTGDAFFSGTVTSTDGRYVAFNSASASLSNATQGVVNVFVRDLLTNKTILVSRASGANGAAANQEADVDGISADGRRVAFGTAATNLSPGSGGVNQVYVRDLKTNTTTLVSRAGGPAGRAATTDAYGLAFSANGNRVVIETASSLDLAGAGGKTHLYLRDLKAQTTTLIDRDNGAAGTPADQPPTQAAIDANGGRVAWDTRSALAGAPADNHDHVFLRDLQARTTTLVSRANGSGGASANDDSDEPAIDAAGEVVAFDSLAPNLGVTAADVSRVFVRNIRTARTQLVSLPTGASGPFHGPGQPSIDAAGDRVAFEAQVNQGYPPLEETFLRDLRAQTTALVSRANGINGAMANGSSGGPSVSANGNCIAFTSRSTNLGDGFASSRFISVHMRVVSSECPINPPDTIITRGPRRITSSNRPQFRFRANEPHVRFQCRIDRKRFVACRSPFRAGKLSDGPHTFTVRAIDQAGFADPRPATRRFTVDPLVGVPRFQHVRGGATAVVRFVLARRATVVVRLVALAGRHRRTLTVHGTKGTNRVQLGVAGLPPGRYRLTAQARHGAVHAAVVRLVT